MQRHAGRVRHVGVVLEVESQRHGPLDEPLVGIVSTIDRQAVTTRATLATCRRFLEALVRRRIGRQVDGAISAIEALPGVVAAVEGKIPVIMDSGIRGGADAFKAIALGAKAVCIGRPYVYGLALAGEKGVLEILKNYRAEFELTMGLAGCKEVSEITRETIWEAE